MTSLRQLSLSLKSRCVSNGEIIMKKGDLATEMYILFSGKAGVYINSRGSIEEQINRSTLDMKRVAEIVPGSVFGNVALEKGHKRNASVFAEGETVILCLGVEDHYFYISRTKNAQNTQYMHFLHKCPFFMDLEIVNWHKICGCFFSHSVEKGVHVASEGEPGKAIFIVYQGSLRVDAIVDIDTVNKYPITKDQWEATTVTKKYQYYLGNVQPGILYIYIYIFIYIGEFIGHREIIEDKLYHYNLTADQEKTIILVINADDLLTSNREYFVYSFSF